LIPTGLEDVLSALPVDLDLTQAVEAGPTRSRASFKFIIINDLLTQTLYSAIILLKSCAEINSIREKGTSA
jgi:hypothetical protein